MEPRPKLGISACVAGESVRFNGGPATQAWITETLAPYVDLVPVCPEVAMGLGVPREAMRLVRGTVKGEVRLETSRTQKDLTELAETTVARLVASLPAELEGFILMNRSPTCGLERVKVYGTKGIPEHDGTGLFAKALRAARPDLLLIEAGRLTDQPQRDAFLARLYALARLQRLTPSVAALQEFHAKHKFLLLAAGRVHLERLGALAAAARKATIAASFAQYAKELSIALAAPPRTARVVDALTHMYGYLKNSLSPKEKQALLARIEAYRAGSVPLSVPLALLSYVNETVADDYIAAQALFRPHPVE